MARRRAFHGLRLSREEEKLLRELSRRLGPAAPRGALLAREAALVLAAHVLGQRWPRVHMVRERGWRRDLQALLLASLRPGEARAA